MIAPHAFAQGDLVPFRARFWYKDGVFSGRLGGRILSEGSFATDSNGEISLLVSQADEVRIVLSDPNWTIIYPREGIVPVPRDENTFAQIIVARAGEAGASTALIQKIERLQSDVAGSNASVRLEIQQLKDSLSQIFDQKTMLALEQQLSVFHQIRLENEKRDSLQREQKKIGRLEVMGLLTSTTDHYITRTEDLRDAFKFNGYKAFNNGWVVDELNEKILAYNEAYEELNRSKNKILDRAEVNWNGDEKIVGRIRTLLEYALDEVHKMTTLSANNLINDIRDYRDPRVKKKNKRDKREITSDIDRFTYDLSNRLSTLISRKSEVFQLLETE